MAVYIEPAEYVIGLRSFEHWIYRTAEVRHRHDPSEDQHYRGRTPRSEPGDLDLVCYSLRKYARLAAADAYQRWWTDRDVGGVQKPRSAR